MEITYDKQANALATWFNGVTPDKSVDTAEDIFVDTDACARLAGIEVLHASEKANLPHLLILTLKLLPKAHKFRIQMPDMMNA